MRCTWSSLDRREPVSELDHHAVVGGAHIQPSGDSEDESEPEDEDLDSDLDDI